MILTHSVVCSSVSCVCDHQYNHARRFDVLDIIAYPVDV